MKQKILIWLYLFFLVWQSICAQKKQMLPKGWIPVNKVMALVNEKVITKRDVWKRIPFADPELRKNPAKLKKEEERILRELVSFYLLEEGIYSLNIPPEQIDAHVNSLVNKEIKKQIDKAGSMEAYLEDIRTQGYTFQEKKEELKSRYKREIFLYEKISKRFISSKMSFAVTPGELYQRYISPSWKMKRTRPGYKYIEIYEASSPKNSALLDLLNTLKNLKDIPFRGKLPEGIIKTSMCVVDCEDSLLSDVISIWGKEKFGKNMLVVSRESISPELAVEIFKKGKIPRVFIHKKQGQSKIIRIYKEVKEKNYPFNDPSIQKKLKEEILGFKMRLAEYNLLKKLWIEARIWPFWLKSAGPIQNLKL